jgi:hypothetical protein
MQIADVVHDGVQSSAVRIHPAKSEGKHEMKSVVEREGSWRTAHGTTEKRQIGPPNRKKLGFDCFRKIGNFSSNMSINVGSLEA